MTIEELKALAIDAKNYKEANTIASLGAISGEVWELLDEILALVEVVEGFEAYDKYQIDGGPEHYEWLIRLFTAMDAFNAKLEAL